MKKALILFLTLILLLEGCACFAEPAEPQPVEYDYDELTVGSVTPFDGKFFTQLWGNDSSDLDVRMLIHGLNTIEWSQEKSRFAVNPSVVSKLLVQKNKAGDYFFTLTLCDDLYFSDGTKITAWDYAFSFLLNNDPRLTELGAAPRTMEFLAGCKAYADGTAKTLSGVRVKDDRTLVLQVLHQYLPNFYEEALLECVPYPIQVIAPGCKVRDGGNGVYIANADGAGEPVFTTELLGKTILDGETGYLSHPSVCSGPYRLVSYDGTTAEFEINEYYKGNAKGQKPSIRKLIYRTADNATMVDELSRGEYGLLNRCVSADAVQQGMDLVNNGDTFAMTEYMRSGLCFINFCCEKQPMDSLAVRQAIAMCMDKDGMAQDTAGGAGARVDGYYGMGQWMKQLLENKNYPVDEPDEDAPESKRAAYEKQIAAWDAVSLDGVKVYPLDVDAAQALLAQDGWTLNREGSEFRPGEDDVRCKDFDGELVALELKLLCPENSSAIAGLEKNFTANLAQAGIRLDVQVLPMSQVLQAFYRNQERDCDMILMATNFDVVFEPSIYFKPDSGAQINHYNTAGLKDDALYELLVDMRKTDPDDQMGYCRKWVAFQEEFQETLPMLSIYSNQYFDFYPSVLHDYDITNNVAWSKAIVGAHMGD